MDTLQGSLRVESYRTANDVSLESRIANYLYHRHVPGCEGIQTMANLGTVVVRGKLPSRHAKWLCIECCRRVAGVIKLIDQLGINHNRAKRPRRCKVSPSLFSGTQSTRRRLFLSS
ncbi:hypothetical protein Pla144_19110 [Bythopirellula polymerisocia]|uniref:BON domain protein n=1 Tax=Bythopirellula polymerisocia TaxID=2528003 RepID=A0A5C6D157_9BACT|nr:hypothetical protein Pla144_19110 [Bythopirellula polymerisocia]